MERDATSLPDPNPADADWSVQRKRIIRRALSVGLATGVYGISFGAIAIASGLSLLQTQILSLVMFTGGSQFALVGVIGGGGAAAPAISAALLLGARNTLYALRMAPSLKVHGWRKAAAAHLTIDESLAVAVGEDETKHEGRGFRLAFWVTGITIFLFWNTTTFLGAVGADFMGDPAQLGLDAAIPAAFLALLWPRLRDRQTWALALAGAAIALTLTPWLPPGVPVLLAGASALVAGFFGNPPARARKVAEDT